jgi:hypothetical protein
MEDELEGMDEDAEEMIEETEDIAKEGNVDDEAINEAVQEGIKEFSDDAVKEAVSEALEEEGIEPTDKLVEKGREILTEEGQQSDRGITIEEKSVQPPKEIIGSEGAPKGYRYPDRPEKSVKQEVQWPGGKSTARISHRERLEAMRDGLTEFVEKRNPSDYEREQTQEKLEEIEQKLSELPENQTPEQQKESTEHISDEEARQQGYEDAEQMKAWTEDTESHKALLKNHAKEAKKQFIKDIYSTGIGFEGLSEISDEYDQIIREASDP